MNNAEIINNAYSLGRDYQRNEISMMDALEGLSRLRNLLLPENQWTELRRQKPTEDGVYAVMAMNKKEKERIIELREYQSGIDMFLPHDDKYIVTHYQLIKFPEDYRHG